MEGTAYPPRPPHEKPKHTGWKRWCTQCQALKTQVDTITGGETPWIGHEVFPPRHDKRRR